MLSNNSDSQVEPTIRLLSEVLDDIAIGKLRVPNFQRPFVWRPDQMLDLFDSIERGYPIGSILLWETTDVVDSLSSIGDIELPPAPTNRPVSYVLDGHQRLSTLFGVLRRQGRPPLADDQREWKWRVYRDLEPRTENERYRHHRGVGSPPAAVPINYLPVRAVNTTRDFLQFSRRLDVTVRDRDRLDRLVDEADGVAQRIKGYKIALIKLGAGELGQAVEVYTRLNRRGVRMDADQVISALTHRSGQRTLSDKIDDIVRSVASTGFGELPRQAVFRSVLAVGGEPDVLSPRWERIADRMQNRLVDAVPKTEQAVHAAVSFLRQIGLPLANLLPYGHQLLVLTTFFHHCPEPSGDQKLRLEQWFWVTSWAGSFAGANSATVRRSLDEMRQFARGSGGLKLDIEDVQPVPLPFNLNSARAVAYIAWEASEFPVRLDPLGQEFEVVRQLAAGAAQAYRPILQGDQRAANRLVLPTVAGTNVHRALLDLPTPSMLDFGDGPFSYAFTKRFLASHGIPELAWQRLMDGNDELFLERREVFLADRLRRFAKGIGVPLGPGLVGVADDDTDHD